ncbi:uncharacterized protein E0L32_011665 [Thyridium curvatum]|uniref:Cell wall biogenesis protein Mhp1 n=1 Tax=Thyridium curvatum TaxID=1093900 RepID=A0A507BI45_9PEZI|nr:uncharacterized protein E0L32_011665 [Thyridium curvatum]TPX18424.1 hypothetical protein E0L32_011665 [Thyridium curvatum]
MEHIHGIDVSWMTHGSSKGAKNVEQLRVALSTRVLVLQYIIEVLEQRAEPATARGYRNPQTCRAVRAQGQPCEERRLAARCQVRRRRALHPSTSTDDAIQHSPCISSALLIKWQPQPGGQGPAWTGRAHGLECGSPSREVSVVRAQSSQAAASVFLRRCRDRADAKKKKLAEKSEGEALKNPKLVEEQKEQEGVIKATGEEVPKEPSKEGTPGTGDDTKSTKPAAPDTTAEKAADGSKKKEKKKKSEEERKARKEKKRKLAEANGSIPMEIHADSDSSSEEPVAGHAPRVQYIPTTNPVRIYRRCCQLRETPILKKITEQLSDGNNFLKDSSMVDKLDLTGYWLQLPDLITLGDYLAVVPIREVILENCGLTDEGLRVILAGLLAAKKPERRSRKPVTEPDGLTKQGGVVERLVLKNNKIGPEGWKHICLFIYMCRTIKSLDISSLHFPHATTTTNGHYGLHLHEAAKPLTTCQLLAKSIGERLAGPHLELINIGDTGLNSDELGAIIDGMIKCGINRLGLAHNDIDAKGVEHVSRYIASGKCEGLDLGGNPMQDHIEALAHSLSGDSPLRAISLAECNLTPSSLCKLLPPLVKLKNFLFIDLSHNHELFNAQPSAVAVLRRFLPKMRFLKRIHLADVSMNASQAIALAEILPEIPDLAHINFLQNPELTKLADARTEEHQEEACALFASLLAATRVSHSIIAVDIDVPTEQSGEIVRAMAKQVVAYCLRNMERLPLPNAASMIGNDAINIPTPGAHPDVIQHLVGHDSHMIDDEDGDEAAPDDDYVIGGTGVVKALACCLDNRGDESRRPSGEFGREPGSGASTPRTRIGPSKAKDMSKHLLGSARRIRHRLQPALARAKASAGEDTNTYHRLLFLDQTLDRMIKRFEDEFPETRETEPSAETASLPGSQTEQKEPSINSAEGEMAPVVSDGEDETEIRPPMSRSNSVISMSSKGLTNEEGRILRAGHRFRSGWFNERHINLLAGVEEVGTDPMHVRILHELLDDIGNEELKKLVEKDGPIKVFKEHRDLLLNTLREQDPEHWASFMHSQWMARANIKPEAGANQHDEGAKAPSAVVDEVAVSD